MTNKFDFVKLVKLPSTDKKKFKVILKNNETKEGGQGQFFFYLLLYVPYGYGQQALSVKAPSEIYTSN